MHQKSLSRIIYLAGPTASGKSSLALEIAQSYPCEIVNADASQLYQDLSILTARPSKEDLEKVPHHLYGSVDLAASEWQGNAPSVAWWCGEVDKIIQDCHLRQVIPIICGGSGLYLRALEQGMSQIPKISEAVRQEVRNLVNEIGANAAWQILAKEDQASSAKINPNDSQRIARGLEVIRETGIGIEGWHQRTSASHLQNKPYQIHKILLMPDRDYLLKRQELRLNQMIEQGVLNEVKALLKRNYPVDSPIHKAIGVREFSQYLNNEIDLPKTIENILISTRQYTKRQSTWFRNQYKQDVLMNTKDYKFSDINDLFL